MKPIAGKLSAHPSVRAKSFRAAGIKRSNSILDENCKRFNQPRFIFIFFLLGCVGLLIIVTALSATMHHSKEVFHSSLFQQAILVNLTLTIPIVVDVLAEIILNHQMPKDFLRPFTLALFLIPNVLIYSKIMIGFAVGLAMFVQNCGLTLLVMHEIVSSSTTSSATTSTLKKSMLLMIISLVFAFLYSLSYSNTVLSHSHRAIWKAIFTCSMVASYGFVAWKSFGFIRQSSKFKGIFYVESTALEYMVLIALLILTMILPLTFLILYPLNRDYFTHELGRITAIEYYLTTLMVSIMIIKNVQNRETIKILKCQLKQHMQMTRSISHEIRTPLNTALMAVELLQDGMHHPSSAPQNFRQDLVEWMDTTQNVKEACDIALGILNQLLTFDKLASNMLQLERKLTNCVSLLDTNIRLFKMQALQLRINFQYDLTIDEAIVFRDIHLYIDEHKIHQVLRNLLSNAFKFTGSNGTVQIKMVLTQAMGRSFRSNSFHNGNKHSNDTDGDYFGCLESIKSSLQCLSCTKRMRGIKSSAAVGEATGGSTPPPQHVDGARYIGMLRISVIDSGPGIAKEDQGKLFQEYVQINPGELQKGQGSGLGLSISKSIVALHGGKIGVFSQGKGKGSTFFVELPAYHLLHTDLEEDVSSSTRSNPTRFSTKIINAIRRSSITLFAGNDNSHKAAQEGISNAQLQQTSPTRGQVQEIPNGRKVMPYSTGASCDGEDDNDEEQGHPMFKVTQKDKGSDSRETFVEPKNRELITSVLEDIDDESDELVQQRSPNNNREQRHQTIPLFTPIPVVDKYDQNEDRLSIDRLHFLVVDDSTPNRRMLNRLLTRNGHSVTEADDGSVAVEIIRNAMKDITDANTNISLVEQSEDGVVAQFYPFFESKKKSLTEQKDSDKNKQQFQVPMAAISNNDPHSFHTKFDVVVMDNHMLRMNGPQAATIMRSLGYKGPILGVTGALEEEMEVFFDAGADTILPKPVNYQAIVQALTALRFN